MTAVYPVKYIIDGGVVLSQQHVYTTVSVLAWSFKLTSVLGGCAV